MMFNEYEQSAKNEFDSGIDSGMHYSSSEVNNIINEMGFDSFEL